MSTLVLISSSPPRAFARSPTPAASSSPALPSPSILLHPSKDRARFFKSSGAIRDGFSRGFTTAATLLKTRIGGENIPVSPRPATGTTSTKGASNDAPVERDQGQLVKKKAKVKAPSKPGVGDESAALEGSVTNAGHSEGAGSKTTQTCSDSTIQVPSSPLFQAKATTRRNEWTPPKDTTGRSPGDHSATTATSSFFSSFGYKSNFMATSANPTSRQEGGEAPTKRRRVELVETSVKALSRPGSVARSVPLKAGKPAEKKLKSPKKKYTTITGRATSQYFGDQPETAPILQYLNTNPAIMNEPSLPSEPSVKVKKPRVSKVSKAKKSAPPTTLADPRSALKSLDSQDLLFGTASQLARDDSPTLIRDTVQALRASEVSSALTSFSSFATNRTCSPSTRLSTSRFARSRNLWSAAGRDDEDTLLQVDAVDLVDSPNIRRALAANTATAPTDFEAKEPYIQEQDDGDPLQARSQAPVSNENDWLDVDATTPKAPVANASESTNSFAIPGPEGTNEQRQQEIRQQDTSLQPSKGQSPAKPLYSGFTEDELKKQLKKYRLKAPRGRAGMIKLLERCWEEKKSLHLPVSSAVLEDEEAEPEFRSHGDVLSDVYGLASRPEPKAKKTRKRKSTEKKDDAIDPTKTPKKPRGRPRKETSTSKANTPAKKATKKSKKKSTPKGSGAPATPSTAKRKKSETSAPPLTLPDDEIVDSDTEEAPTTIRPKRDSRKPTTPAPVPVAGVLPEVQTPMQTSHGRPTESVTPLSPEPDLASQITKAITTFRAEPGHDHQKLPTWHEKILMYDPIVLEDLAAWLNTEGFRGIGEDREVGPAEVREWCEAKGVCCLWRGGWRGNGRYQ